MRNFNDFKIVEKRRLWYMISTFIVLIGLIFTVIFGGLNLGIDFTGGSTIEIDGGSALATQKEFRKEVSTFVKNYFAENDLEYKTEQYSQTSSGGIIEFKFQQIIDGKKVTAVEFTAKMETVRAGLKQALNDNADFEREGLDYKVNTHTFSTTASKQLLVKTFLAVGIALILIFAYIILRFNVASGLSSITALLHDVFVLIALTAIFRVQVNASFLAAVLTVIGYSINASVIIFDKVRYNAKSATYEDSPRELVVNDSIKQTFKRNIYTMATTLITVVLLAVLGVTAIREFVLPIIFGIVAGTYSSLTIAGSLWVNFNNLGDKIKKNKENKKPKKKKQKKQSTKA